MEIESQSLERGAILSEREGAIPAIPRPSNHRPNREVPVKSSRPVKLVAITGGSGSGKSWLADQMLALLGEQADGISLDCFYHDHSHLPFWQRQAINFDRPGSVDWALFERVLQDCADGRTTEIPQYDFKSHCRNGPDQPFRPKSIVLVDGLWLLLYPSIRRLFDLKVYVDCPEEVRLQRRIQRDQEERGRSPAVTRRQFHKTVAPMHACYVAPQTRWADYVLRHPDRQLESLHGAILKLTA